MKKILVHINVPQVDCNYDIMIPPKEKIINIINIVNKNIKNTYNEYMISMISSNSSLYNKYSGIKYDTSLIIEDTDIVNNTYLVLINE